jgi:hypothetical protein
VDSEKNRIRKGKGEIMSYMATLDLQLRDEGIDPEKVVQGDIFTLQDIRRRKTGHNLPFILAAIMLYRKEKT